MRDILPTDFLYRAMKQNLLMTNRSRICSNCDQPNAFTMDECNKCGGVTTIDIEPGKNIMILILNGEMKIHILNYKSNVFMFLDPLQLCVDHYLAIPTDYWIPHWFWLLTNPVLGLEIVKRLKREVDDYNTKIGYNPNEIICGFNFPPSQFHLHLQVMPTKIYEAEQKNVEEKVHFKPYRFFDIDYVIKVLEAMNTRLTTYTLWRGDNMESMIENPIGMSNPKEMNIEKIINDIDLVVKSVDPTREDYLDYNEKVYAKVVYNNDPSTRIEKPLKEGFDNWKEITDNFATIQPPITLPLFPAILY